MSRRASPFRPVVVLTLLLVGAGSFLLLLYAMGAGWTGQNDNNGDAHAASNSLTGFSGLVDLLERRGHTVSLGRSPAEMDEETLIVLTPGQFQSAEDMQQFVEDRLNQGPTIMVLPKWSAIAIPSTLEIEAEDDWVMLLGTIQPGWFAEVESFAGSQLGGGSTQQWSGFGLSATPPDAEQVHGIRGENNTAFHPLITDSEEDMVAAYLDRNGYHPLLASWAGITFSPAVEENQDASIWPFVVVADPDLFNNYGLAEQDRAILGVTLIEATLDGFDLPIVFDMTIPGVASSQNLLTLAFTPPFLAATLALLLAALVITWRAFKRFGPPLAEAPALAQGKRQLARNGAALIERAKRWHLLGAPYAAILSERVAAMLHIRASDTVTREAAIDAAMQMHGVKGPPFSQTAQELRRARRPAEILRAASALRSIERMLKQ